MKINNNIFIFFILFFKEKMYLNMFSLFAYLNKLSVERNMILTFVIKERCFFQVDKFLPL